MGAGGPPQQATPTPQIRPQGKGRSQATRNTRRIVVSLAAALLAGLCLAAPRPATAQYAFTTVDFPGAASTDLLGFSTRTMVGQFADADGNTHGWLFSAKSGPFQQFDAPGAWFTTLSAINQRGDFGGVYRNDLDHPA